ncbi:MAG: DUF1987 domain-containing protein [Bacteroidales bacterium]|nr:DUF1987 domain-containing protein [Bacteroidales bacterium]MBN2632468.1 DUF1987 domain-containing protein [Bacteroidales bacterium]
MESGKIFFTHEGPVTYKKTDLLLVDLKKSAEFRALEKTTARRVYAILVEILENIVKHSEIRPEKTASPLPFIYAEARPDTIHINSGNPVSEKQKEILKAQLQLVNELDPEELKLFYEDKINRKTKKYENGAGLGFILIRLKSGSRIGFSFDEKPGNSLFFTIHIIVNKYIMRKLIIERTSSSPRVLLDPENNIFEIEGESRPADVADFYIQILNWFDDYSLSLKETEEKGKTPVFNLFFEYFNSSSAKYILDFCKLVAKVNSEGRRIIIRWHYESDDPDMLEAGKEMSKIARLPFEFVERDV